MSTHSRLSAHRIATAVRRRAAPLPRTYGWPFVSLRRTRPFSREYGFDRGDPIDRYYIEDFFRRAGETGLVRGRVLEVGHDMYTRAYGDGHVTSTDVLYVDDTEPGATVVADLTDAEHLPDDGWDTVICAETLHLIYDVHAAMRTMHRILAPGGTLLLTVPGIQQICRPEMDAWGDFWRFTDASLRRIAGGPFDPADVHVETHGNVMAATAFLNGLAQREVRRQDLDVHDRDFQLVITLRATKR